MRDPLTAVFLCWLCLASTASIVIYFRKLNEALAEFRSFHENYLKANRLNLERRRDPY
ncbi:MAG: hypothetical protein Fur0042_12580 [Cyanophyceae cyanobacterium]